jgi:hypothetical protein
MFDRVRSRLILTFGPVMSPVVWLVLVEHSPGNSDRDRLLSDLANCTLCAAIQASGAGDGGSEPTLSPDLRVPARRSLLSRHGRQPKAVAGRQLPAGRAALRTGEQER